MAVDRSLPTPRMPLDDRDELGESPVFDDRTGELLRVDITLGVVHRWSPDTGARSSRRFPTETGAVLLSERADTVIVALAHELRRVGPEGEGTLARLPTADPKVRFNDCRCDPTGRIYAGTVAADSSPGLAALYRLTDQNRLEVVADDVTVSNGIGWDPVGERMYYIDSPTQRIDVFDYDLSTGEATARRPWVDVDPGDGTPDGLAVDSDGGVWVCLFGGGRLRRYGPEGSIEIDVSLPVTNPTCPAFGGRGLHTLYVTSARHQLSDEQRAAEPEAGAVLAFDTEFTGLPPGRFRLAR